MRGPCWIRGAGKHCLSPQLHLGGPSGAAPPASPTAHPPIPSSPLPDHTLASWTARAPQPGPPAGPW